MAPLTRKPVIAVLAVLVIVSGAVARPQQNGAGSVEGLVVRLGTTEPIAGVNVEMRRVEGTAASPLLPPVYPSGTFSPGAMVIPNSPNPADAHYATTGSDGTFRFTSLKPGKYRLLGAHPAGTYYPAEYGQRNPRGPGYDFSIDDTNSMKVRMEMAPMGSVSGHVTGADGKPAVHAHVLAAEIAYQNGSRVLNQVQGVETDDRGNYRLFWLPPGRYYIGAFPEGIRRRQTAVPFGPPAGLESVNQLFSQPLINFRAGTDGQLIRDIYEVVYSPGETNPNSANVIDLRLGSNVGGIDIALAPGQHRALRVRGVVTNGTTGRPAPNVSIRVTPQLPGPVIIAPTTTTDDNGVYEIDGVLPGQYFIVASLTENVPRQSAMKPVAVENSDIDGVNLTVLPAAAGLILSGRITVDGIGASGYRVRLVRDNAALLTFSSDSSIDGALSFTGVEPGNYRVTIPPGTGTNAATYLKSIRLGGVETIDGMVQIGESVPGTLEVVLSRIGGIAEGRVLDSQRQPTPNVLVVLVPADSKRPDRFKTATADLAGHYRIQNIPPGNYLAFAWPWLPSGIWQYPEFLNTVLGRGTRVTISEGSNGNVDLTLLPEVTF